MSTIKYDLDDAIHKIEQNIEQVKDELYDIKTILNFINTDDVDSDVAENIDNAKWLVNNLIYELEG